MNKLFEGLTEGDAAPYLRKVRTFEAGAFILRAGETPEGFGVVLEGIVEVYKEDYFGNKSLLSHCRAGDIFLEAVTMTAPCSPVNVLALTDVKIAILDYPQIFAPAQNCRIHATLLENLLRVLSVKILALNRKISVLSARTIREKILAYFKEEAGGQAEFVLPFTREEFGDYLCVDRSALSRELSNMKKRGELDFSGTLFRLSSPHFSE